MGLTKEQTEERFGHIINAYNYGAPPHAGAAAARPSASVLCYPPASGGVEISVIRAFPTNELHLDIPERLSGFSSCRGHVRYG